MIPTSTANAISRTTVYLELSRSAKSSSFFERVLGAVDITPTILSMLASTELRRSADKITSKRTSNKPFSAVKISQQRQQQVVARRDDMPPRRRWQFDLWRIYVRPRTGPQSAHLWWPASCRQPACL